MAQPTSVLTKERTLLAVIGDEVSTAPTSPSCLLRLFARAPYCILLSAPRHTLLLYSYAHDQDSITGLLLAGVGHINDKQEKNFLIVDSKTQVSAIEAAFTSFTERKDIAILLINQHVRILVSLAANARAGCCPCES